SPLAKRWGAFGDAGTLRPASGGGQGSAPTQNFGYRRQDRNSEVTVTNSAGEGPVTRVRLREYAAVQRLRYQQATRAEKHQLLDEIVAVTGLHRKAAIRLLGGRPGRGPALGPAAGRARTGGRWRARRKCCGRPAGGSERIGSSPSSPSCWID